MGGLGFLVINALSIRHRNKSYDNQNNDKLRQKLKKFEKIVEAI